MRRILACILGFTLLLAQIPAIAQTRPRATNYQIPTDVQAVGGGETAKSTNYVLDDTIGEANIGESRSDNYQLDAGYRQTTVSTISLSCGNTVNLGTIVMTGQATGTGSCTVTTDAEAGYALSWRNGVNEGMAGYWPLDETTGSVAYDHTGNANDGDHQNAPTISEDVPSHYFSTRSLSFDGSNDYVSNPEVASVLMKGKSVWAVSFWAMASAYAANRAAISFNAGDGGAQTFAIYPFDTSGGNGARVHFNGTDIINQNSGAASVGAFHHYAFVSRSATDHELYVDGRSVGTSTSSKTLDSAISQFNIGAWKAGNQLFAGNIDDVRVYDRTLSQPEIQQLASKAPPGSLVMSGSQVTHIPPFNFPSTGGLVGHWRMDEPVSGTVADASGKGRDGTPNGTNGANNKPRPTTVIPASVTSRDYRSLDFDGTDDYVDLGTTQFLNTGLPFSVTAWTYLDAYGTGYPAIFASKTDTSTWRITYTQQSGYGNINFGAGTGWAKGKVDTANVVGGWHQVIVTYNGNGATDLSNFALYLDGEPQTLTSVVSAYSTSTGNGAIGLVPGFNNHFFDGKISDLRVYSRALTAAEIKALYGTPQTWSVASNAAAFGARLRSASTDTDSKWGTDMLSEKWLAIGDGSYTVVSRTSSNHPDGSTQHFQYRAEVGAAEIQPAGLYQGTMTITAAAL